MSGDGSYTAMVGPYVMVTAVKTMTQVPIFWNSKFGKLALAHEASQREPGKEFVTLSLWYGGNSSTVPSGVYLCVLRVSFGVYSLQLNKV